jgi:hypothetical protein
MKIDHEAELKGQQIALVKQCESQKQITEDVSHDYQTKLSTLNRRIANLKRLYGQTARCVPVAKPTTGHDATANGRKHVRENGILAERLIEYAGEAEQYRLQLKACQSFINKERGK